jgi:YD repeat-containing protein
MSKVVVRWIDSEAATAGQVPVADGAGKVNWQSLASISLPSAYTYYATPQSLTSATWVDVPNSSISLTLPATGKIFAIATLVVTNSASGGGDEVDFRLVVADETSGAVTEEPYDDLERCVAIQYISAAKAAGTYTIKLQAQRRTGSDTIYLEDMSVTAIGLSALKGDKGDTGSGSTITVQDEGSPVAGTPHNTLNFVGDGVTVTNAGGGVATVTIPINTPVFGTQYNYAELLASAGITGSGFTQRLRLTTGTLPAGDYRLEWHSESNVSSTTATVGMRVQIDDTTTVADCEIPRRTATGDIIPMHGFGKFTLTNAVHNIDLDYNSDGSATHTIRNVRLELWRVS